MHDVLVRRKMWLSLVLSATFVAATTSATPCPAVQRAPRGWNSWDAYANAVNETAVIAAAEWVRDNLLQFGFDTITIDGGWCEYMPRSAEASTLDQDCHLPQTTIRLTPGPTASMHSACPCPTRPDFPLRRGDWASCPSLSA